MSEFEWRRASPITLSPAGLSERSRQLPHSDHLLDEESFLSEGSVPEPFKLSASSPASPRLGAIVEKRGLSELPIGEWGKEDVLAFTWHSIRLWPSESR